MATKPTFEEHMKRVDRLVSAKIGLSTQDMADCPWWDSYDDGAWELNDEELLEDAFDLLAEYDDTFAHFREELGV